MKYTYNMGSVIKLTTAEEIGRPTNESKIARNSSRMLLVAH